MKTIPHEKGLPLLGFLPEFRKDIFAMDKRLVEKHGNICSYNLGPNKIVLLAQPDYIKHVLQENYLNYKKDYFYDELKLALGQGLVTSEGDFWHHQRKLIQPAFHRNEITQFAEIMERETKSLAGDWQNNERSNTIIDLTEDMKKLTMKIVSQALFGIRIFDNSAKLSESINYVIDYLTQRLERYLKLPPNIPTPRNLLFRRHYNNVHDHLLDIISNRRENPGDKKDLLSMLLAAQNEETGLRMSDQQLFDEIMTLFMAGHETTAHALVWTWYLLNLHPYVESQVHDEIENLGEGINSVFKNMEALPYTRAVILESMRLIPPVWGIGREASEDDQINGFLIPAGTTVYIPIRRMHRHPDHWNDPEKFDPDRFLDGTLEKEKRWVYMPFGGGPRQCIGNHFAVLEAQIALAVLASLFQVQINNIENIEFNPGVTLRPKNRVLAKIQVKKVRDSQNKP